MRKGKCVDMNRKAILWMLLDLIFLVVFNIVFFVVGGGERHASVWISYAFIHFAYIMAVATPYITKNSKQAVFGYSVYAVSSLYFILEFVIGVIFILVNPESFKPALVVQLILAAIYLALLIIFLLANEKTDEALNKEENENSYIKSCSSRIKTLIGKLNDSACDKTLEKLYDLVHSSPSRSSASVAQIEQLSTTLLSQLETAVIGGDKETAMNTAAQLEDLFRQRISILKAEN